MNNTNTDKRQLDEESVEPNIFLGIIGSIFGALLGAILWVVIYQFGIIASVAGIAIIYCSYRGYSMLSKSTSMTGIIISIIMSLLMLIVAHFLCWGWDIYSELGAEYGLTLIDSIIAVPQIAFTEEFVIGFIRDLAMGIVLIGVGASKFIRDIIHDNKRRNRY